MFCMRLFKMLLCPIQPSRQGDATYDIIYCDVLECLFVWFGCMALWQFVGTEMDCGICDECSVLTAFALVHSPGPRPPHIF